MSLRRTLQHLPARLALAIALGLPASAIAAPAVEDPASAEQPNGTSALALVTGIGTGLITEPDAAPFNPVDATVDYGTAINRFGGGGMRTHEGQDMFAPEGTRVVSPLPTTVLETGADGGRGNWAAIYDAAGDRTFVYMHMLEPAAVSRGDELAAGDEVGLLGCTGSCDGAHLHFEIRAGRGPNGPPSDPLEEQQTWDR
jgi:murein DD-endopeptidase MepM/ murein hydrolase activator NlpD